MIGGAILALSIVWLIRRGDDRAAAGAGENDRAPREIRAATPSATPRRMPAPTAAEEAQPPAPPADRDDDPATIARAAVTAPYASVAEERETIVRALADAGACGEPWCTDARATLDAWVAGATKQFPGDLQVSGVQCSGAGCWVVVKLRTPEKFLSLTEHAQRLSGEHGWPGMSMFGGPDTTVDAGTIVSLWAVFRP